MAVGSVALGGQEIRRLWRLGSPLLVGQLAQTGMGVTDTLMAGRYAAQDLAAIAIGQSLWLPMYIFLIGLFSATTTQIAHHSGAGNRAAMAVTALQSFVLALLVAPFGVALLYQPDWFLGWLQLDTGVRAISADYLRYLSAGLPAACGFLVLRALCEGQGGTRIVMAVNLLAFVGNIPLNYLFIYGYGEMAPMGGAGCGVASSAILWLQFLLLVALWPLLPRLRHLRLRPLRDRWQPGELHALVLLGLPVALSHLAEVGLFSVMALIIAPLGAEVLAGHQVALSVSGVVFMLPLSVGLALNIQVGQYLGAGCLAQARFCAKVGLLLGLLVALLNMALIWALRDRLAQWFSDDAQVIAVAAQLLLFTAWYQLPDAVQICLNGILRGFRDTRVPLLLVLLVYWGFSVPLGYILTNGLFGAPPLGAPGVWSSLVAGLTLSALLLGLRYASRSRAYHAGAA